MKATQQPRNRRQCLVASSPFRIGRQRHLTENEPQSLPAVLIDTNGKWSTSETFVGELPQEPVDRRRMRIGGPKNMFADTRNRACVRDAALEHFLHLASIALEGHPTELKAVMRESVEPSMLCRVR